MSVDDPKGDFDRGPKFPNSKPPAAGDVEEPLNLRISSPYLFIVERSFYAFIVPASG